jgi:hypothetical protein
MKDMPDLLLLYHCPTVALPEFQSGEVVGWKNKNSPFSESFSYCSSGRTF